MPALIKPGQVKIQSKDGEVNVSITLDLNINLNEQSVSLISKTVSEEVKKETKVATDDKNWIIPDFGSTQVDFGK